MESIMSVVNWVQTNWKDLVEIISMVIAAASIIVRITPTIKDNIILEKIIKFLSKYVAINRTVNDDAIRNSK